MADVYAVLDTYEPPHASPETIAALTSGIARWLAQGNDPALLPALLRASPKLQMTRPEVAQADLNGDGMEDVLVQTQLMGLPVLAFLQQEDGQHLGLTLPPMFDEPLPTLHSGFLSRDLTGRWELDYRSEAKRLNGYPPGICLPSQFSYNESR